MTLKELLVEKKAAILERWFDQMLKTYPVEFREFLREQKNPFSNPVGSTFRGGIEGLFQAILRPVDPAKVQSFLDDIIRIRAIQDFSPSQAVAFVPLLKEVIREELGEELRQRPVSDEWLDLYEKIDQLTLRAFDIYVTCREKLYQIKTRQLKGRMRERGNTELKTWEGT